MKKHKVAIAKAFSLNAEKQIYGSFAEIGAGQETANHFFKAGLASQTVAKSMSAYDMTFSDHIYGKQARYVCRGRLITMLNHEYQLLQKRLSSRSKQTCFFSFANTASTSSSKNKSRSSHSWMGIRFQTRPLGPTNDITFHVANLNTHRLDQYEALGILGVNLIYASFFLRKSPKKFITSLSDYINKDHIEINGLNFSGPDLKPFKQNAVVKEVFSQGLSQALLFSHKGSNSVIKEEGFEKPFFVFPDSEYDALTLKKLCKKASQGKLASSSSFKIITTNQIPSTLKSKHQNFFLLVSLYKNIFQLKQTLRIYSKENLTFFLPEARFDKELNSLEKQGILLENLGALFDKKTRIFLTSSGKQKTSRLKKDTQILKDYLKEKGYLVFI